MVRTSRAYTGGSDSLALTTRHSSEGKSDGGSGLVPHVPMRPCARGSRALSTGVGLQSVPTRRVLDLPFFNDARWLRASFPLAADRPVARPARTLLPPSALRRTCVDVASFLPWMDTAVMSGRFRCPKADTPYLVDADNCPNETDPTADASTPHPRGRIGARVERSRASWISIDRCSKANPPSDCLRRGDWPMIRRHPGGRS